MEVRGLLHIVFPLSVETKKIDVARGEQTLGDVETSHFSQRLFDGAFRHKLRLQCL